MKIFLLTVTFLVASSPPKGVFAIPSFIESNPSLNRAEVTESHLCYMRSSNGQILNLSKMCGKKPDFNFVNTPSPNLQAIQVLDIPKDSSFFPPVPDNDPNFPANRSHSVSGRGVY